MRKKGRAFRFIYNVVWDSFINHYYALYIICRHNDKSDNILHACNIVTWNENSNCSIEQSLEIGNNLSIIMQSQDDLAAKSEVCARARVRVSNITYLIICLRIWHICIRRRWFKCRRWHHARTLIEPPRSFIHEITVIYSRSFDPMRRYCGE